MTTTTAPVAAERTTTYGRVHRDVPLAPTR